MRLLFLLWLLCFLSPLSGETIRIAGERMDDPRSLPGQVSIISQDEINSMAPRSMGEILDSVPGIEILRQGGLSEPAFVSIRGSSAEQVLILVNGRRLNTAQGGGVDLNSIRPEQIERIEILRGAGALQYGQGSLGGIVNIVLKEADSENRDVTGSVYSRYGSFQSFEGGLSLSNRSRKLPLFYRSSLAAGTMEGAYSYNRVLNPEELQRENTDRWFLDASLSGKYQPDKAWSLNGEASVHQEDKGVPGTAEFPTEEARMVSSRYLAAAGFQFQGERLDWVVDLSWLKQERFYENPDYYLGPLEDRHRNQALSLNIEGGTLMHKDAFNLSVDWGGTLRRDTLDSTALSLGDGVEESGTAERLEGSVYLQNQWDLGSFPDSEIPRFSLTPSLRVDGFWLNAPGSIPDSQKQAFSWNLGGMVNSGPAKKLVFKANTGQAYRLPGFDDLFWSSSSFAVGNPSLLPEKQFYIDGGLLYQAKKNLSLELVLFHHQVEQLILWELGPGGLWTPRNIGRAQLQGVEAELRITQELSLLSCMAEAGINGNYLHPLNKTAEDIGYNDILPRKALGQVNSFVVLNFYNGASFRVEGHYTGMRFLTAQNTKWLDPYWVLNLSGLFPLNERWRFSANVQNLLNRSYVDIREYPVPGIQGSIEVRYDFGERS